MSNTSSQSSTLSETIKLESKRLSGPNCWACNTRQPQICHVVAQQDTQIEVWEKAGLFNFAYKSVANAIPLCPSCHVQFDLAIDPGYIFFPADLHFFINFELEDRERRRLTAESGFPVKRQVPTAKDYKDHQIRNGSISPEDVGGLYRRVFLKNFLHDGMFPSIIPTLTTPKCWHGDPMASLRRAIAALGSPRIYVINPETRSSLEQLRDLYFSDTAERQIQENLQHGQQPTQATRRSQNEATEESVKKRKGKTVEDSQDVDGHGLGFNLEAGDTFILGPTMTANEVIQKYAPVLEIV
ncbi:hypothetical protein MaudCBS49596_005888 [Microsporum audouinii]